MKAIFLYSKLTGSSFYIRYLPFIKRSLSTKFDKLETFESSSLNDLKKYALLAAKEYDYFIFAGGDGTVNEVINILAPLKKKPILCYIPAGTTNDFAKNFRLKKDIHWSIKNILKGKPAPFDVLKVNNRYVSYVLACGAFSGISYTAKRSVKKRVGSLAYYLLAMKDVFLRKEIKGTLRCNNRLYRVKTPFLLVLNGNHVGGFYINFKNKMNDGKFHIFITKPGIFNGLLHYLFFKMRTTKIITNEFSFTFFDKFSPWCVDGEMDDLKNIHVKCCPSLFQMVVPKRVARKLIHQED